jgi:YHS domain-containing protein
MTRNILLIVTLLALGSCHNNPQNGAATGSITTTPGAAPPPKPNFKALTFDYKKDPACGMPLTAGVEDTLHYKGKLYGFCSKECKEAFLQNPDSSLAQIIPPLRK